MGVFSLTGWFRQFHMEFHVLHATQESIRQEYRFSVTGLSPSMAELSRTILLTDTFLTCRPVCCPAKIDPTTPDMQDQQA